MDRLNIVGVVVPPGPSHPFGVDMVGHNIVKIREGGAANCALAVLLGEFSVQQLAHLGWRPKFPESSGVVRILDALNPQPQSMFQLTLVAATAG